MTSEGKKIKVGITQGDINGIGYEVIIKTLAEPYILDICTPVVYGSPKVAAYHRKLLGIQSFNFNMINNTSGIVDLRANIINCCNDELKVEVGKSTEEAGLASFNALEKATSDLKEKTIDVLVTAPINKNNIQSKQFNFPGHTEYLETLFGNKDDSLMLLINEIMRIAVVTNHTPIRNVAEAITEELILKKLRILNKSLNIDFGIRKPRIAVLGLNPHAGDNGTIGNEEKETIIPAIKKAEEEGILCIGPYPADGFFGSGAYHKFDAILAMYHDQGLAPFKALSMESGVNYTAGLSVIRTSPAHGTAFDIAGQNIASEESFRNALYLACDIYKNRALHKKLTKNQLKTTHHNLSNRGNQIE